MAQFYLPSSGALYTDLTLLVNTGFPPTAAPSALAANGIYTVTPSPDPYDPGLYTTEPSFVIAGNFALESWVATPLPLPTAKANGTEEVQIAANLEVANIVTASGYSAEVLAAAGAALEVDRPAVYQTVIAEQQVVSDNLAVQVEAIDAATTVDEINNIVNPPTGIITTSRTGNDFNDSSYISFVSTSLTEADTELFIPGTSTVIPYILPNQFNGTSEAFNTGDYLVQIREASTGLVLADFICPDSPTDVDVPF